MGGGGADIMVGSSGDDVFRYIAASDSTAAVRDRILDFNLSNDDTLNFHGLGLSSTTNQGATPGLGQLGWVSAGGNTTVYANTAGGAMQIYLQGTGSLTSSDFLLTS